MRLRSWTIWLEIAFLVICLGVGLVLAQIVAPKPIIGVAHFEGLIDAASAQQMGKILEAAGQDRRVVAVVMEINSYGGDASSSEKVYHAMVTMREQKPLVVAIDGAATSGGYYMAVAGNKIYAPASTNIGNVGARTFRPWDPQIIPDLLSTGPYKLTGGSRFDGIHQLELVKDAFVGAVVHQRNLSVYNPLHIDANTLAEAHVYLGSEALALGLIDAQGGLSDAIQSAGELAGVKGYRVVELTDYLSLPFEPSTFFSLRSLGDPALPGTVLLLDSRILLNDNVDDILRSTQDLSPGGTRLIPPGNPLSPNPGDTHQ
jgi:protease-4